MKKALFKFIAIIALFSLLFTSCKEKGTPLIVWRSITDQMVNPYGAYLYVRAKPDSLVFKGIHVLKIWSQIYDIRDTIILHSAGVVYSPDNPLPDLRESPKAFFVKDTNFVITDSLYDYYTVIDNLELDKGYYVRSFIIYSTTGGHVDTAYNQIVKRFSTSRPEDIWFVKQNLTAADARTEAVSFVINNTAYIGLGKNGLRLLRDFWKYLPDQDQWESVSQLPGAARYKAVAFVLNDTVYVGSGLIDLNDTLSFVGDFWKSYSLNFWQQIDYIDSSAERYDAIGFGALYNNQLVGFVALGKSYGIRDDIYMYNPGADADSSLYGAWFNIGNFPTESYGAAVVVYPNKEMVLVAAGKNDRGYVNKFYKYIPTTGEISEFTNDSFPGPPRYNAVVAFVKFTRDGDTHEMFYYGTGQNDTAYFNDWYAYDLTQDKWYVKSYIHQDFIVGPPRAGAVSFAIDKGVVQYGLSQRVFVYGGYTGDAYLNDVWEYLP